MKKRMIPIFVQVCLMGMFFLAFPQQREDKPVVLEKISERLYQVLQGRGANGGAFIGEKGVLLIDAKMNKESVDQTIAALKEITEKPLKFLVSTHSDGDHISGNKYFPTSVTFVAHENCRKEFFHPRRNGEPSEWNNPQLLPYVPSITFQNKMDLYLGADKVELWYFGVSHTTGDAVVYFPEEKVAFLGDQIFIGRPQLIHSYKGGNSFEHVKTVSKMFETLDAEKFCTGHADMFGRETVKKHLAEMKQRQDKIISLVEKKQTLEQIKSAFNENEARLVESIYNEIKK